MARNFPRSTDKWQRNTKQLLYQLYSITCLTTCAQQLLLVLPHLMCTSCAAAATVPAVLPQLLLHTVCPIHSCDCTSCAYLLLYCTSWPKPAVEAAVLYCSYNCSRGAVPILLFQLCCTFCCTDPNLLYCNVPYCTYSCVLYCTVLILICCTVPYCTYSCVLYLLQLFFSCNNV